VIKLDEIDGVFSMAPFIATPEIRAANIDTLISLRECASYFIDLRLLDVAAKLYDPESKHMDDPCAWPLTAKHEDLEGLPPHVISVNELDPLRDEGLAYYDKLKSADVRIEKRVVEGIPHCGDMWAASIPGAEHVYEETIHAIKSFAEEVKRTK